MQTRKFLASLMALSLLAASSVPPSLAAAAATPTSIGVAGAVKGLVRATPELAPESVGRVIQSGKPLYLNEHVTTGPGSHLQLMLNDETVFSIGPNSDVVLDEFVYNPETQAGKVSASVTKGVFRFITGNIGKKDPSKMEVNLPAGTIGIRGTIVAGQVNPNGTSMVVLLGPGPAAMGARVGAFNLSSVGGSVFVDKPGFGSTLLGGGAPPTRPILIAAEQMKAILGELTPKTMAQRTQDNKEMVAARLAQKMATGKDEKKLADKMLSGAPLTKEEQARAREGMEKGNMPEAERKIAEKMMTGGNLTPTEQQQIGMMMAGEQMLEGQGANKMTPEQRQIAEKMMAGTLSPEQQRTMMQKMSPEQQALVGDMMPPPGGMPGGPAPFRGGDPALMGGTLGMMPGAPGPYGGIGAYTGTPMFFNNFYDPNRQPIGFIPPPGTTGGGLEPTTWEAIRGQVVAGTGTFPGQTGVFRMNTCGGGACVNPIGSWGYSNMVVDFGAKTMTGTGNITAAPGGVVPNINDTVAINFNFSAQNGNAMISAVGNTTKSNYMFTLANANGVAAGALVGNATFNNTTGDVHGAGDPLISFRAP